VTDKLTIHDCRKVGFCIKGVKRACVVHGQDFKTLVREGLPLSEMDKLDDISVKRACDKARERIANGQR